MISAKKKKAFTLEESFHCPWEQGRRRGYNLTSPAIWLHFIWVWQRKNVLFLPLG